MSTDIVHEIAFPCYNEVMEDTSVELQNKFISEYNLLFNVPKTKADEEKCVLYKAEHPNEFKNGDWSIDRHRKRFMDWMSKQAVRASQQL